MLARFARRVASTARHPGAARAMSTLFKPTRRVEVAVVDTAGVGVDNGSIAPLAAMGGALDEALRMHEIKSKVSFDIVRDGMGLDKFTHVKRMLANKVLLDRWMQLYGKPPTEADAKRILEITTKKLKEIVLDYNTPTPHAVATYQALQAAGVKVAFTSGYPAEILTMITDDLKQKYGLTPDFVIAADQVSCRTRAGMVHAALSRFHALPSNAVFVTDAEADLHSVCSDIRTQHVLTAGVTSTSTLMCFDSKEHSQSMQPSEVEKRANIAAAKLIAAGAHTTIYGLDEFHDLIAAANNVLRMGMVPGMLKPFYAPQPQANTQLQFK